MRAILQLKMLAKNLALSIRSAQGTGEKFDTVDFSVKISNDAGKKFDTNSLVARFKNLPVQTKQESGADVLAANALIMHF